MEYVKPFVSEKKFTKRPFLWFVFLQTNCFGKPVIDNINNNCYVVIITSLILLVFVFSKDLFKEVYRLSSDISQDTFPVSRLINEWDETIKSSKRHSYFFNDQRYRKKHGKNGLLCTIYKGRLGNMLFQFASTFGVAKSKNMTMIINKNSELLRIFMITVTHINDNEVCNNLPARKEERPGMYDENILALNPLKSYKLIDYLQSWRYFDNYSLDIREQLQFRPFIRLKAEEIITNILKRHYIHNRRFLTLIAVHVRRGDMTESVNVKFGRMTATPEYLRKSFYYFKSKYNNTVFIIASDGMEWVKANMPFKTKVEFISTGKRELDLAVLSLCDHAVTTVGSFSWWVGWLTGGEVTYFKWPARPGTIAAKFKKYPDYFHPTWKGL